MPTASTAITTSVAAAFLLSGFRKAGTPFDTASTPVIAVHPFANAVRIANRPSDPTGSAFAAAWSSGTIVPVAQRHAPTASSTRMPPMKK